jgi:hypothetical protein
MSELSALKAAMRADLDRMDQRIDQLDELVRALHESAVDLRGRIDGPLPPARRLIRHAMAEQDMGPPANANWGEPS